MANLKVALCSSTNRSKRIPVWVRLFLMTFLLLALIAVVAACGDKGASEATTAPAATEEQGKTQPEGGGSAPAATPAATATVANVACAECHEMWPEVTTWQISSHSQIACEVCHQVDVNSFRQAHETQSFNKPIKVSQPVPNAVCEQCHSPYRVATPSGDLIIPHDRHAKAGVACTACHANVVHANIAPRAITTKAEYSDYAAWTPDMAKKVSTLPFVRPSMWTCLDCHKSLKVTTKCAVCHTVYTSLPSHEAADWGTKHGVAGRQNVSNCSKCHANKEGPTTVDSGTGDKIIDFERATPFCYNCHKQRPASHNAQWMPNHPAAAGSKGLGNCLACHSADQPKAAANVTGTYCNSCHWFQTAAKPPEQPAQGKEGGQEAKQS